MLFRVKEKRGERPFGSGAVNSSSETCLIAAAVSSRACIKSAQMLSHAASRCSAGKCPTKWAHLARKHGILPSIVSTGTLCPGKAAPHLLSALTILYMEVFFVMDTGSLLGSHSARLARTGGRCYNEVRLH